MGWHEPHAKFDRMAGGITPKWARSWYGDARNIHAQIFCFVRHLDTRR